jgi:hypothetical protein
MLIREFLFPFRPESTRACYNMCTQEYTVSNLLYKAHSQVRVRLAPLALTLAGQIISNYLVTYVQPSLHPLSGDALLLEFERRWRNHEIMNRSFEKIFGYLVLPSPLNTPAP